MLFIFNLFVLVATVFLFQHHYDQIFKGSEKSQKSLFVSKF